MAEASAIVVLAKHLGVEFGLASDGEKFLAMYRGFSGDAIGEEEIGSSFAAAEVESDRHCRARERESRVCYGGARG